MAGLLLVAAGGQAQAGSITFGLSASPNPVAPGGNLTVDVYLQETDGTLLADVGVFAATFRVTFSNATDTSLSGFNGEFDFWDITPEPGAVLFDLAAFGNPPVKSLPGSPDRLFLGSVSLTVGNAGWVSVGVQVANPGLDNVLLGDGTVLDAGLGSPSIRVAIVPEPTSVVLMSLGTMTGLGLIQYRRRRAA